MVFWFESGLLSIPQGLIICHPFLAEVRFHRWYVSKVYNCEIRLDIMISFTKLRIIQHGAIFDYNSHLRGTMVERSS